MFTSWLAMSRREKGLIDHRKEETVGRQAWVPRQERFEQFLDFLKGNTEKLAKDLNALFNARRVIRALLIEAIELE